MADFFKIQTDYILFCYGLSLILLAPISHLLSRRLQRRLPWGCLGLFGTAYGLSQWLGLVALDLGSSFTFDLVRLGLMTTSFIFLVEFGRVGTLIARGRAPGRWVLAVLLVVATPGGLTGIPGLFASSRYILGLVGGLWAAQAIYLVSKALETGRRTMEAAALGTGALAIAIGLVVNFAPFPPASWLNESSFFESTGLPIQLVRAMLAFWVVACLALLGHRTLARKTERRIRAWSRTLLIGSGASMVVLLMGGWLITQHLGEDTAADIRADQEGHVELLNKVIQGDLEETDHLVNTMARSPWIEPVFHERTAMAMAQADSVLDRYSDILPGTVCYLMDRDGLTVASSNRDQADSFVGQSYRFRPYFEQAIQGRPGRYWALGITSHQLGYYASYPVHDPAGQVVGVAVIKRPIREVRDLFHDTSLALVVNSEGIVVMANNPQMILKSLSPLSPAAQELLLTTRQFGTGTFTPILALDPVDRGEARFQGNRYLVLRQPFFWEDWSTLNLAPLHPIVLSRLMGMVITLLLFLGVIGCLTIMGITVDTTARIRSSERRYRGLYESLRDGSAAVNMEGKLIECNPAFQAMLGYTTEEIYQLSYGDITPEKWHPLEAGIIEEQVHSRGYSDLYLKEYRHKDGTTFPVELQTYLIRDHDGCPTGMWTLVRDITEHQKAEESLRKAHREWEEIFQAIGHPTLIIDAHHTILAANRASALASGKPIEDFVGRKCYEFFHPEISQPAAGCPLERLLASGRLESMEMEMKALGGTFLVSCTPMFSQDGKLDKAIHIATDITLRKQAEESLRKEMAFSNTTIDSMPGIFYLFDHQGKFLRWNENLRAISGYSSAEISRMNPLDFFGEADKYKIQAAIQEVFENGEATVEADMLSKDGLYTPHLFTGSVITFDTKPCLVGMGIDISDRKRAEEAFKALVDHAPMGIYIVQNGQFAVVNPGFEEICGYTGSELIGRNSLSLVDPDYRETVRKNAINMLKGMSDLPYEFPIITKNGEPKWVMEKVTSTVYQGQRALLGYFLDISEQKTLESHFLQAQKMEAIGRLAGGVAHDFNNMLNVILGYCDLMNRKLIDHDPLSRYAAEIKKAGERAASLTQQLLSFSRKQILQPQVFRVSDKIAEVEDMLKRLIGEDIELLVVSDPDLGAVKADPGIIEQAIINLAINARDAMPDGGKLTIETANVLLGLGYTRKHFEVVHGQYVMLAVTDNGQGMDAATQARIFEPFFTTKGVGKGTGLGLSTVYGIVKQSGGHIQVYSEIGQGTTFKIYLPQVKEAISEIPTEQTLTRELYGSETILVVEDEDLLREMICGVLDIYGYTVLEARHGGEAILISERHPEPIHLMVTDVVMPQMSGRDLMNRLQPRRPDLKVLYMSGYTENAIIHHGVLDSTVHFIQKPFPLTSLMEMIRKILDEAPTQIEALLPQ